MKKIKPCNYEILNFEQDPLVCDSVGNNKKTNKGFSDWLKKIVKRKGRAVTKASLKRFFKKEKVAAK